MRVNDAVAQTRAVQSTETITSKLSTYSWYTDVQRAIAKQKTDRSISDRLIMMRLLIVSFLKKNGILEDVTYRELQ
jgi:hypothetical protein